MKVRQGRYFSGQGANGGCCAPSFPVQVDAKASNPGETIGRVRDFSFFIEPQSMRRERRGYSGFNLRSSQGTALNVEHLAFETDTRRDPGNQQQVATRATHQG